MDQKELDKEIFNNVKKEEITRFEKITVRDFVFLAICAASSLLFSAVMPLVANVPVYGLIQIVVGFQTSLFFALGLFKVRKRGSILFMAVCSGIVQVFMAPVMFFMSISSALIIELIFLIFKKGYHYNVIRILATTLYIPFQMPLLWIYYEIMNNLPSSYVGNTWWFILLMVLAVVLICFLGTLSGSLIGKELQKAGVLDVSRKKQ